jgi:hypothetical protein
MPPFPPPPQVPPNMANEGMDNNMFPEGYPYPPMPSAPWPYDWFRQLGQRRAWRRRPYWGRHGQYRGWSGLRSGWPSIRGGWSGLRSGWRGLRGGLSPQWARPRGPLAPVRRNVIVRDHRR